jgi:hypothetical protein
VFLSAPCKCALETQVNEVSANISEKRISTDVFDPRIKAIDFTKESVNFGEIITIK